MPCTGSDAGGVDPLLRAVEAVLTDSLCIIDQTIDCAGDLADDLADDLAALFEDQSEEAE